MLAKGNRSKQVTDACKRHGGFYLGSIGGPAARLAQDNIRKVEVLEYPELGMEAVWRIEVEDFPAFIIVDDKGNDFFDSVRRPIDLKTRSEEHTSELQSLMRISYAVFCLKKKKYKAEAQLNTDKKT